MLVRDRRILAAFLVAPLLGCGQQQPPPGGGSGAMRPVLLVGNAVSGTVSVIDEATRRGLGTVNVIPDLQDRLDEINGDLIRSVGYMTVKQRQVIRHFEPSGGDRFVDDVFVSPDGRTLYVSRSNLGDVAAFDLTTATHPLLWHTRVDGFKADHATLSPDGARLVVSATSVDKADVIDATSGALAGSFATGHFPHQNDYSADGRHIYNGSIGDVSLPQSADLLKGARQLTVVDAQSLQVVRTYTFSAGVRPTVVSADEKTMYAQLSYLNGVIKYDLTAGAVTTILDEPQSAFATANYPTPDDYPHDSAHHGLALSGDGRKLCDAGTIDNTVSLVLTASMTVETVVDVGLIPYWATTGSDGKSCFVSLSGNDSVTVIDYATGMVTATVPVGRFPQRSRLGRLREQDLPLLN